jgi:hypothetical protein
METHDSPTFERDIRPKFSQWDRVQMMGLLDLWNYESVRSNARNILLSLQTDLTKPNTGWSLLPYVHVMPLVTGPWPGEWIELFSTWIEGGCLQGEAPPQTSTDHPFLPSFMILSEALTGFDDLHSKPAVAAQYLARLLEDTSHASLVEGFLKKYEGLAGVPASQREAALPKNICDDPIAKRIILMWYNAGLKNAFGWYTMTPKPSTYVYGLVWRAISAHASGYATENIPSYWRFSPSSNQYTGAWGPASPWREGP